MSIPDSPQLRLQPLLIRAVVDALFAIFCENRHADKVIEHVLRNNKKAGSRDRAFIAENTYEIVRYYRLYAEVLGRPAHSQWDFWQVCGIHFINAGLDNLPALAEFKTLQSKTIQHLLEEKRAIRAIRESVPDWLDQLGQEELQEQWDATLHELNRPARVVLRANRLKTDRNSLIRSLAGENIETEPIGDGDALALRRRQNVFQSSSFQQGLFEVQDYSSQQVAPLLQPAPGMRVVDACAGSGGKTLHLSAMMHNRGSIIALDTFGWKLDALRLRARRSGASNIETRLIENSKTIKRLYGSADRLLLDVPCSGLGVIKRNPDTKWKLQPEQLDALRHTQQELLQSYSPILKAGGKMVYATCSILPSENRQQVEKFLESPAGKDFTLLEDKSILPQSKGFDGFYMALLEKKG